MSIDWILQSRETRRLFANSTWVPLRASARMNQGEITAVGHVSETFGCGCVAFPPQHRRTAEGLSWDRLGLSHKAQPFAYEDGHYSPVDEYQYNDKEPIGVELIFEHDQPVVGGRQWILNPDLVIALRLIKEGKNWVRPEEDFTIVARETIDENGSHSLVEIKREFLLDYLTARGLSLRLSYYRQRVENVSSLRESEYAGLTDRTEQRDGGRFELRIRDLNAVFGGNWAAFRVWRTDVDPEEDAPVMGPERNDNTEYEHRKGQRGRYDGVRVEGEFWRDEWIDSAQQSVRVRGDEDPSRPRFIVETDGSRLPSRELNSEDIGRWLWFRPNVISDLLKRRGFSLLWYSEQTGAVESTSGYTTHFGINSSDLVTVYANDVARLATWEQHVWAAHNVVPDGKVSSELLAAQVKADPASTHAPEELLFLALRRLERDFKRGFGTDLFTHGIDDAAAMRQISRFVSEDRVSLLRLAKELVRVFSDRISVPELRKLSKRADKNALGSNKLLQDVLSQRVGDDEARRIFGVIAGTYEMRVGDAHPTGSKISDALKLAEIDENESFLRQGQQLIYNFGRSIRLIDRGLFDTPTEDKGQ